MKKFPPLETLVPNITTGILVFLLGVMSWKIVLAFQWLAKVILPFTLLEQAVALVGALAIFYYTAVAFQYLNGFASRQVGALSLKTSKTSPTSPEPTDGSGGDA